MKRLSREAFDRARQFLKTQARPLDRAMFEHLFEAASAESVMAELAHFQNEDGGFGRALEPDLRTPSSSALMTGIGLRTLKGLGCSADHPMVRQAVSYLLATFDHQTKVWRVAPHDTNAFPHAGWWHDEDGSLARTFDGFLIIPRAEIVGLLHHFASLVPADWLNDLTELTVTDIEVIEALGTGGGDDLRYALSLAETKELPPHFKRRLTTRIRAVTPAVISRDPQEWDSYCISPLKLASSPQSVVADLLWDDLHAHLDYQIDHQTLEGTWNPVWTWGDFYPDAWEQAKLEWRGHLTLNTLIALQAFRRIEEQPSQEGVMSTADLQRANEETREAWNQNAAFWDERMGEGNDFVEVLIWPATERLLELRPGERVLDIACGNGLSSRRLAAMGAEVAAFDFAAEMIAYAIERTTEHAERIEYLVLDATDEATLLALGEGQFDAALCNMALFDMAEIKPLMRALARLLRPGGRFVFSVLHPCFNSPHIALVAEMEDREGDIVTAYSVKIFSYITPMVAHAAAMRGQPKPQLIFHRPLQVLLSAGFDAGFVLDGLEERAFPPDHPSTRDYLSWGANFSEIPPVLVARMRLPG